MMNVDASSPTGDRQRTAVDERKAVVRQSVTPTRTTDLSKVPVERGGVTIELGAKLDPSIVRLASPRLGPLRGSTAEISGESNEKTRVIVAR